MRILIVLFVFFSFSSLAGDTTNVVQDTSKHSVRTAVLLSIVPGAGQIYNHIHMPKGKKKAFWKVPLIYAGLGVTTYYLIRNQREMNRYRNEYTFRQNNNGIGEDPGLAVYDNTGILTIHEQYQRWRDFSILGVFAVYALQMVDAGVEAHFVKFDVSEDLSMRIRPSLIYGGTPTAGIKLQLNFR